MPRIAREYQKSTTGTYHIILRGINQQEMFLDDMDRKKFLKEVKESKKKYQYQLLAYVLMNNHVHMLVQDEFDKLSKIIQSIATRYAMYFNKKYERIGHLFYNRFKSKQIEDTPYLLNVVKYIHKNPQKDGICKMEKYLWSSYQEYTGNKIIADTEFILSILSTNSQDAIKNFITYHSITSDDDNIEDMELEENKRLTDDQLIIEIKNKLGISNILEIQNYSSQKRKELIREILTIPKVSKRQLARVLGINRRTVFRAIEK